MNLKEYLKETCEKVDNKEDEGGCLGIYMDGDTKFMYHDECFADFQEDFCILYDKHTKTNMVIPYAKITMMQYMTEEIIKEQAKEMMEDMDFGKLFRKMLED